MKKFLLLVSTFLIMLISTTAFAIEGEGTEESPFLITNQEELCLISDFPDCHFELMNDIVLQGDWTPLCTHSDDFTGSLNGNGYTISNLSFSSSINNVGLIKYNYGVIKNLQVGLSENGMCNSAASLATYIGIIAVENHGEISSCKVNGAIICRNAYEVGGITGINYGNIYNAVSNVDISVSGNTSAGGIAGKTIAPSSINNSYFIGSIANTSSSISGRSYLCGIAGNSYSDSSSFVTINNCYSVATYSRVNNDTSLYGITASSVSNNGKFAKVNNSFYDKTISGLTSTSYGTPKSILAMKMKKTYADAGWDFDNVWGISSETNDGYPYLLWEYEDNSSATADIIGATSTDNSLKLISEVSIEGDPEISTFGTTFIPLWLFESGSTDVATVEYDNENYNIQNAQTYGATLTNIPQSCKDMDIVGKSYIKNSIGNYEWSAAKYTSVNDTTLNTLE